MRATLPIRHLPANRGPALTGGPNSLPRGVNADARLAFGQPGAREGDAWPNPAPGHLQPKTAT